MNQSNKEVQPGIRAINQKRNCLDCKWKWEKMGDRVIHLKCYSNCSRWKRKTWV